MTADHRKTALLLVAANLATHYFPPERPGFQPDDFTLLAVGRDHDLTGLLSIALHEPSRPLGRILYLGLPWLLGLRPGIQLLLLMGVTSALAVLTHTWLSGLMEERRARLAALMSVLWPVRHEIHASLLMVVPGLAAIMALASGLLFRRYIRHGGRAVLATSAAVYLLSLLTYEIGALTPIIFLATDGRPGERGKHGVLFGLMAVLAVSIRWLPDRTQVTGGYFSLTSLSVAATGSLVSNLAGLQLFRTLAYGLWGVAAGGLVVAAWATLAAFFLVRVSLPTEAAAPGRPRRILMGFGAAILLAAPALPPGVLESRHSVLAAIAMGVIVVEAMGAGRRAGTALIVGTLALACTGLAARQAEVSRLQARVFETLVAQMRTPGQENTLIDLGSLATRVDAGPGARRSGTLAAYWGLNAFSARGLRHMAEEASRLAGRPLRGGIRVCATPIQRVGAQFRCPREFEGSLGFDDAVESTRLIDLANAAQP